MLSTLTIQYDSVTKQASYEISGETGYIMVAIRELKGQSEELDLLFNVGFWIDKNICKEEETKEAILT